MSLFVHGRLGHFLMDEAQPEGEPAGGATPPASEPVAPPAQPPAAEPPAQPEAPKPVVPEAYAFSNLPEGYTLSPEQLAEATPLFKELGLTQEQAEKLMAFDAKRVLAASSPEAQEAAQVAALEAHNKQVDEWVGSLKSDAEFGGAKFDENVKIAQKAMEAYGSPELTKLMDESGMGSHPLVVKFMHKVGMELGEGKLHRSTTEQPSDKDWAQRMYPGLNP